MSVLLGLVVTALAYANGANDNSKGVATLFGSGVSNYRGAIVWGTLTTLLGSLTALYIAQGLLATFSGAGLVPAEIAASPAFSLSVGLGAAATVWLAVRLGFPISTTHALVGGLIGAGTLASVAGVNFVGLWDSVLKPLLFSPVIALVLALVCYPLLRLTRKRLGIERNTCVCVGTQIMAAFPEGTTNSQALAAIPREGLPSLAVGSRASCEQRYSGRMAGVTTDQAVNLLHYLSAGAVSFARGVNDTPKIAALLLVLDGVGANMAIIVVGLAMAAGGLISARRVAETMAHGITRMNAGQGLTANLITSFLVIVASRFGLPVSTTQVAAGALFGIGAVTRQGRWNTITQVVLAWVITLPLGALAAASVYANAGGNPGG